MRVRCVSYCVGGRWRSLVEVVFPGGRSEVRADDLSWAVAEKLAKRLMGAAAGGTLRAVQLSSRDDVDAP